MNHKGVVWTLWDRPRGNGGVSGGYGGVSSYGENGTFDSVHHQSMDEVLRDRCFVAVGVAFL